MNKAKATNKKCYFYNENYDNNCRACSKAYCNHCKMFKPKDDKRQILYDHQFQETRKLLCYSPGYLLGKKT